MFNRQLLSNVLRAVGRAVPARALGAVPARVGLAGRVGVVGTLGAAGVATSGVAFAAEPAVDYAAVRAAIEDAMEDENHDDGSFGPIFIRLGWHASGTFCAADGTGGSVTGGSMRFAPESEWGANAGLGTARARLEPIKQQFPGLSYGDLWTLAAVVAIEYMGGPKVEWSPGRVDCAKESCPFIPDGRLPDAAQGHVHLRDIFYRMGFNDQEIVALSGAHTLGRCHTTSSGFVNPWTNAPTTFSNLYFKELTENKWTRKEWDGPEQYEDPTGELMMLPTDLCLLFDKSFRTHVDRYAADEELFTKDFAKVCGKLFALGMPSAKPWYQFW